MKRYPHHSYADCPEPNNHHKAKHRLIVEPNEVREWALKRGDHFLKELRNTLDPLEIEAQIYTLMRTFENAYDRIHAINKEATK